MATVSHSQNVTRHVSGAARPDCATKLSAASVVIDTSIKAILAKDGSLCAQRAPTDVLTDPGQANRD